MDQLLKLSPDSPEFRAVLLKHLPQEEIKTGIAFNSNGPDFVWAVESASHADAGGGRSAGRADASDQGNQPVDPPRQASRGHIAPVPLPGQRREVRRLGRRAGVHAGLVCATGSAAGQGFGEAGARQQGLPGHGDQLLDLRSGAIQPRGSGRADGVAGRRTLHVAERRRVVPAVSQPVSPAGSHRQPDPRQENPGDDPRVRVARRGQRQEHPLGALRHGLAEIRAVPARGAAAGGLREIQHPQGRLQPRHPGAVVGRHRGVQRGVAPPGGVQPRLYGGCQLHRAAVAAGRARRRERLSRSRCAASRSATCACG